jgi:hypothetical protein
MRPDGTLHVVCNNHGALTPPYSEREISESGKERIAASMRAYWQRVKAGEVIRPRRKKNAPAGIVMAPWQWKETPEEKAERLARLLREKFPDDGRF